MRSFSAMLLWEDSCEGTVGCTRLGVGGGLNGSGTFRLDVQNRSVATSPGGEFMKSGQLVSYTGVQMCMLEYMATNIEMVDVCPWSASRAKSGDIAVDGIYCMLRSSACLTTSCVSSATATAGRFSMHRRPSSDDRTASSVSRRGSQAGQDGVVVPSMHIRRHRLTHPRALKLCSP
nr:hypothetical protein CFP56_03962 [Quercus suber]